ncbi:MAG: glutamine--fructose-6-phosphate transaminase (isomerizing), partial [Thiotrichales bacterium]
EYRGYDSAGMAIINKNSTLKYAKVAGKVEDLERKLTKQKLEGTIGIAHTRWATHGKPVVRNAHPHIVGNSIAIVHNGIIDNFDTLRQDLIKKGVKFQSDTDSEIIVHLVHRYLENHNMMQALRYLKKKLTGSYALLILDKSSDALFAFCCGLPLVVGKGIEENFIASDSLAFSSFAQKICHLQKGDIAIVTKDNVNIINESGRTVAREIITVDNVLHDLDKGSYDHYMLKEIHQQPDVITETLNQLLRDDCVIVDSFGAAAAEVLEKVEHIRICACGTSYHAGLIAKHWLEEYAGIHCDVEIASELRYRKHIMPRNSLFLAISQSGETADTLLALKQAKERDYLGTMCISNMPYSSMVQSADMSFITHAGIEKSVASTKAFSTQLVALLSLTILIMQIKKHSKKEIAAFTKVLTTIPKTVQAFLKTEKAIKQFASKIVAYKNVLFLGRGINYPVVLEGSLKLKEISYIHAEAYPAGELKHGPLALVDRKMPVVVLLPEDNLTEKTISNIQEVLARGGKIFVFTTKRVAKKLSAECNVVIVPKVDALIMPVAYTIPLQLLAYHVAVLKGTDIDHPRNLAKSVTVE